MFLLECEKGGAHGVKLGDAEARGHWGVAARRILEEGPTLGRLKFDEARPDR